MKQVLTAQDMMSLDAHMIQKVGIPSIVLMENAAAAVCSEVSYESGLIVVLCGCGNNGGDGIAIARKLFIEGKNVRALLFGEPATPDAKSNFYIAEKLNLPMFFVNTITDLEIHLNERVAVIIDAIFGIGLSRNIVGLFENAIKLSNNLNSKKIAVDIPSGVNADSGEIMGVAFRADKTVTFQSAKRGHLLFPGREFCGKLIIKKIGMAMDDYNFSTPEYLLEESDIVKLLPKRNPDAHKGSFGKALLIAGSNEYVGACIMSANAALRAGAGLLRVVTTNRVAQALYNNLPEAMVYSGFDNWDEFLEHSNEFEKLLDWADCIAIGSGMGDYISIDKILATIPKVNKPLIIDADGLNALSKSDISLHRNTLLTPHIGEFSRLTKRTKAEILADSVGIAQSYSTEKDIILLLKGATTIISSHGKNIFYDISGNAGLATGGSGDVLTGLILGLSAQGLSLEQAACCGSLLLGAGADKALKNLSLRALLPTDVISNLPLIR